MRSNAVLSLLMLALLAAPARAHVMLAAPAAKPGSAYLAQFRVGHGCSGSPTIAIRVAIPAAVANAVPQAKPGWTITLEHDPSGRIDAATWRGGPLAATTPDSFAIQMMLPQNPQILAFPTTQTCQTGSESWSDMPGKDARPLAHPAPLLNVTPSDMPMSMPGMGAMHM